MIIDKELITLIAPQLVAIGAMWLRLEHRITRLETNYTWLMAGRRHKPTDQPPDAGDPPAAGAGGA